MNNGKITIAIDGPSGAGKSTVSKRLAQDLGLIHIDTGAMYRALTYKALAKRLDLTDEKALTEMALDTDIVLTPSQDDQPQIILVDGENITQAIRTEEVSRYVSQVAQTPGVRAYLLHLQRTLAAENSVVMDGRDIGTVVLPAADYKFYLSADLETRAHRRYNEIYGSCQDEKGLQKVRENLEYRDTIDSTREFAPLRPAEDAIIIDTTNLTIEQVVARLRDCIRR